MNDLEKLVSDETGNLRRKRMSNFFVDDDLDSFQDYADTMYDFADYNPNDAPELSDFMKNVFQDSSNNVY